MTSSKDIRTKGRSVDMIGTDLLEGRDPNEEGTWKIILTNGEIPLITFSLKRGTFAQAVKSLLTTHLEQMRAFSGIRIEVDIVQETIEDVSSLHPFEVRASQLSGHTN